MAPAGSGRETTEENSPPGARTSVNGGAKLRLAVNQSHERLAPAQPTDAPSANAHAPTRPTLPGRSPDGWRRNQSTTPSAPRNAAPRRFQPQHQPWPPVCAARGLLRFRRWFHPALSPPKQKSPARAEAQRRPSEQLANPPTALSSHPAASLTGDGAPAHRHRYKFSGVVAASRNKDTNPQHRTNSCNTSGRWRLWTGFAPPLKLGSAQRLETRGTTP